MSVSEPETRTISATVCELGEGPTYDPATDTLSWFDIVGRRLVAHRLGTAEEAVHELPLMASALAVVDDTRQLLATESGLMLRDGRSGRLEPVAPIEADNPRTRSNDARVHPSGAFWVGTMGKRAEDGAGSIYWYREGEVRRLFAGLTITNSICFSPGGDVAYYADTRRNVVWRVACDPETGLPGGEPAVLIDQSGQPGGIDGSVCDADGTIWNARWGSATLDAYDPLSGRLLRSVRLPTTQPSCPAFVGPALDRMAVTSAWQDMDEQTRTADPLAGRTLIVDLPVRGRAEPRVRL